MRIAITQPTYLPWLGYFDLMDQVDTFVILDSVQFEKRSWQQRNRIKTPSGLQWLTVPVAVHGKFEQSIREARISDSRFAQKHIRTLNGNYARAGHFSEYFSSLSMALCRGAATACLVDLNMELLSFFRDALGITTPLVLASSLMPEGKRTHHLADICTNLGATEYLSQIGSAAYLLTELDVLTACNIETRFQNYRHPEYKQLFPPFVPFASTIDLIFNEGERAMDIIRVGRNVPFNPEELATGALETKSS